MERSHKKSLNFDRYDVILVKWCQMTCFKKSIPSILSVVGGKINGMLRKLIPNMFGQYLNDPQEVPQKISNFGRCDVIWSNGVKWPVKRKKRQIAVKSLLIIVEKASTYQNDPFDSIYLPHMHIVTNDVILTSFWCHFGVIWRQFLLLTLNFTNDVTVTSFLLTKT